MSLIERSFTFDNFIVGPCNRHAYAACVEAFENPGGSCNPLFIYGETGTGKTHLLRAIRSMASRSDQKAIFLSGRKACGDGLLPLIQRDMDSPEPIADYLLIDDLQEILCSVDDVKAVLFLFESFERFQPQVVVTSSTAPTMLRGKGSDSLLRRICGGFIVRISSLDIQTRLSITMNEITKMNLPVRGKVASILADLPLSNYSDIRTILLRLLAEADEHIDIDDDFTIGLVTRMIKAGELHFPEGFNLPRKPAAGSLKSPLMEQSGGSHVISYHDQKPSHTPSKNQPDTYLDELEKKFENITDEISEEMAAGGGGNRSEMLPEVSPEPGESENEGEDGLIEEWVLDEERLIEEE